MAFITYPLNNIDYTAEDAELFHCTRTSGIWAKDSFPISVTGADNNVTIGTGIAWINNKEFSGKVAALKSEEVLDLGIADSTYPRIDVIAIQYSANNNATDVVIKKGTPATNPVKPAIVRTGSTYELYLASVYRPAGATVISSSNITDLRMDSSVCGLMADSVTKVDNGIQFERLWQNASTVSNFAKQEIDVDLSEYRIILAFFKTGTTYSGTTGYLTPKNYEGRAVMFAGGGTDVRTRSFHPQAKKITISDGYKNSAIDNSVCIPTSIYGIKGV